MSDIIVSFKPENHRELIRAIKDLQKAQGKHTRATKTSIAVTKKQTKANHGMLTSQRLLTNSFATMRSHLLLYSFGMSMGIRQTIQLAKESTKLKSMEKAFNSLSGSVSNASISMVKLQRATNGTMSEMDLFEQANNAMILGVTKNSDEMAEMFDMAQRLGRALGVDTERSIQSLVTGLGRQSVKMLDNIGIIVKSNEAYEDYADANGLVASKLTDVEKRQAFFNAALTSGRKKMKDLGPEIVSTQDKFDRFSSTIEDLGTAFGGIVAPQLGLLLDKFSDFIFNLNAGPMERFVKSIEAVGVESKNYTNILAALNKELEEKNQREVTSASGAFISAMTQNGKSVKETTEFLEKYGLGLTKVETTGDTLIAGLKLIGIEVVKNINPFIGLGAAVSDYDEGLKSAVISSIDFNNASGETIDLIEAELGKIKEQIEAKTALINANDANKKELIEQVEALEEQSTTIASLLPFLHEYLDINVLLSKSNDDATVSTNILTNALNNAFIAANKKIELLKEEIKLNKQLLQSSASVGRSYKNAGNAAVAAARAAVSAKIQEAVITYMAEAMTKIPFPASLGVPILGAAMAGALGSVLSGSSSSAESNFSSTPRFAEGGYVGGRPHSQGGTIIEAERGEFVMSRNATESIGLETLNQMNQSGGGGSINVSVTGNVLTQDFVEGELAESIKEAVRRGSDFGIG